MQTFLPLLLLWNDKLSTKENLEKYFSLCAKILDNKRLGKQRVEAYQILNVLLRRTKKTGWIHHPVVKQWKPYIEDLKLYENCFINEWIFRGFKNNMKYEIINEKKLKRIPFAESRLFIKKHQAHLLKKNFGFYKKYGWRVKTIKLKGYYWYIDKKYILIKN